MKTILFAAVAFAIGSSAGQAIAASPRPEVARFAAMSLTKDQGVRAIISNVLTPADGTHLAPCQVRVSFFDAGGSLIGNTTTVQLKAGESTSVQASQPSKLVLGEVVDPAEVCALKTSVEVFDVQTGTTFVSIPGEPIGSDTDSVSAIPPLRAAHKNSRKNPASDATNSSVLGGPGSSKTRAPEIQPPASAAPK